MSLLMYQIEGAKDETAVLGVFSKFCSGQSEQQGGKYFMDAKTSPDFCKVVGLDRNDSIVGRTRLEEIAGVMSSEDYEEQLDKFDMKYDKMRSKVLKAKKKVSSSTPLGTAGLSGLGMMSVGASSTAFDAVDKADSKGKQLKEDAKVAKAQRKLDEYIDKNKMLHESKQYQTTNQPFGGLVTFGAGSAPGSDIYAAIKAEKQGIESQNVQNYDAAMTRFREFIGELLNHSKEVGFMYIEDGEKSSEYRHKRRVQLNDLTAGLLVKIRNREMFVIYR